MARHFAFRSPAFSFSRSYTHNVCCFKTKKKVLAGPPTQSQRHRAERQIFMTDNNPSAEKTRLDYSFFMAGSLLFCFLGFIVFYNLSLSRLSFPNMFLMISTFQTSCWTLLSSVTTVAFYCLIVSARTIIIIIIKKTKNEHAPPISGTR